VDLFPGKGGYFLHARLHISIPGMDGAVGEQLVKEPHQICSHSKAIQGIVRVTKILV
jgi:organic hydroperoxide reductase OsmC/OhrA